jgi:hypothetical protein
VTYRYLIRTEADKEILEAMVLYDALRQELGWELWECVKAEIAFIVRNPLACPIYFEEYRRSIIRRFHYGLYFVIEGDLISIEAFMSLRVNPDKIQKRIE